MPQSENILLKPIVEADPVPFTMDTLGWKFVFLLLLFAIAYLAYKYYLHYKNNKYRRKAISKISELNQDSIVPFSSVITRILFLLKQTALHTYDRKIVASLEGKRWLQFLDEKVKGSNFLDYHEVIVDAVYNNKYGKNDDFNESDFVEMSINWIKHHA